MFCFQFRNRHLGIDSLVLLLFFSVSILAQDDFTMVDKYIITAKESKKFELVSLDNFDGETIYKYFRNVSHIQNLSFHEKTPSSAIYEKESNELPEIYKKDGKSLLIETYINNPSREKISIEPNHEKFLEGGYPFRVSIWVHSDYYKGNLSVLFKNEIFGSKRVNMGSLDFSGWKRMEREFPFLEKKIRDKSPRKEKFYFTSINIEFSKNQAPAHVIIYLDRLSVLLEKFTDYPGSEIKDSWGLK